MTTSSRCLSCKSTNDCVGVSRCVSGPLFAPKACLSALVDVVDDAGANGFHKNESGFYDHFQLHNSLSYFLLDGWWIVAFGCGNLRIVERLWVVDIVDKVDGREENIFRLPLTNSVAGLITTRFDSNRFQLLRLADG